MGSEGGAARYRAKVASPVTGASIDGAGGAAVGAMRPGRVLTLVPGMASWVPLITTRSVGASPERTMRRPSTTAPSSTCLTATVPS